MSVIAHHPPLPEASPGAAASAWDSGGPASRSRSTSARAIPSCSPSSSRSSCSGLFAVAFGADGDMQPAPGLPPVPVAQMYLPAMLAAGLLLSGFQNLAIDIAVDRSEGVLKRLGATPLSPVSYFLGKIVQVGVTGVAQAAVLLGFAAVVLQVPLPTDPAKWFTFAWVFVLGITGRRCWAWRSRPFPDRRAAPSPSSSRSGSSCNSSRACTSSSTCSPNGCRRRRVRCR